MVNHFLSGHILKRNLLIFFIFSFLFLLFFFSFNPNNNNKNSTRGGKLKQLYRTVLFVMLHVSSISVSGPIIINAVLFLIVQ